MASSLIEAVKIALDNGETKRASIIAQFAQSSGFLNALTFKNIPGGAYRYNKEGALPGVAFRGINESYTESTGVINPEVEALTVVGGELDVDVALVRMYGAGTRATQESIKSKSLAATITAKLIKGDSTTNGREFDGLQVRCTGAQLQDNGASSGGDPLSLFKLDTLIASVAGPNRQLWLSRTMKLRLTQASRTSAVGGFINFQKNEFGQQITTYNGIPLIEAYPDNDGTDPIAFDEVAAGGGTTATSIYCVSVGDGYLQGLQNGMIEVRDLGEIDAKPVFRTRVEWLCGMAVENGRGIARLRSISNAAVAA